MEIDKRGLPAFPVPAQVKSEGMRMREYYAAHCPMTMSDAYEIWAGQRHERRAGDSVMSLQLRRADERGGFMRWWAQMRFEYADAMIKTNRETMED
jgi:hypothetical protein